MALGACATEEVIESSPGATAAGETSAIVFGTFLDEAPQTSAAQPGIKPLASILDKEGLKTDGFTVLAYSTSYTKWEDYTTAPETPDFMDNVAVTWDSNHWTYNGVKYWPMQNGTEWSNVSFFGFSTVDGATATGVENGNPAIAFETAEAAASQVDLVADTDLDVTAVSNSGKVKFDFDHLLSRIGFSAKLGYVYTGSEATIAATSLKVYYKNGAVKSNGTYTFSNTDNTDGGNWELGDDTFEQKAEENGDEVFSGETALNTDTPTGLNDEDSYLMLIPQETEAGDLYVELAYSVSGDPGETFTPTINLPAVTWAPGKAYTYNFTLTPNLQVDFDTEITVNDWGAPTVFAYFCGDGTPGTEPGATTTFEAFNPCANAAVGAVWYLNDTRESENPQTYKVKKMQDGRIWMVQDLKFGDQCGTDFTGSTSDQTGKVSSTGTYYGDCTTAKNDQTPPERGYLYDWAAAVNKAGAYHGSSSDVGCSGTTTAANACQGICPTGWHVPTGNTTGEFYDLHTNYGRGCANNTDCWNAASDWEGVSGGWCNNTGTLDGQGTRISYWSSTYSDNNNAYNLLFNGSNMYPGEYSNIKHHGRPVRCVRNAE